MCLEGNYVEAEKRNIAEIARRAKPPSGDSVHANAVVSEVVAARAFPVLASDGDSRWWRSLLGTRYSDCRGTEIRCRRSIDSEASTAALAAGDGRRAELVARRERFQDIIDFCKGRAARRVSRQCRRRALRQALAGSARGDRLPRAGRSRTWKRLSLRARIRDVFDARRGDAVDGAARATPSTDLKIRRGPATIDRRATARQRRPHGRRRRGRRRCPSTLRCPSRAWPRTTWLGRTRRRCRYWERRWRDVKVCSVCWDATPRAETVGGGPRGQGDASARTSMMSASSAPDFCKTQLGDVARITGAGLPCVDEFVLEALPLAALSTSVWRPRRRGRGSTRNCPSATSRRRGDLSARREWTAAKGGGVLVSQPGVRRGHRPRLSAVFICGVRDGGLQSVSAGEARRSLRGGAGRVLGEALPRQLPEVPEMQGRRRKEDGLRSREVPLRPDLACSPTSGARRRPTGASGRVQAAARFRPVRGAAPGERRAGAHDSDSDDGSLPARADASSLC